MKKRFLGVVIFIAGFVFLAAPSVLLKAQDAPVIVVENAQGIVGSTITTDLVLISAPQGLQQYAFAIRIANPAVVSFGEIAGVKIAGQLFQVIESDGQHVEFRALDLNNDIRPGDENTVLARITFNALAAGRTAISLEVSAYVDDQGVKIEPQIQNSELTVQGGNGGMPPATTTPPTTSVPEATGPQPIPPATSAPRDLNEDGLFEDINGDGVLNSDDVALLLSNLNSAAVQADRAFFDFNRDGLLDNADVTLLLSLTSAPPPTSQPVSQPGTQQTTVLQLSGTRAKVNESAFVDLILSEAPQGLERYEVRISVSPSGIARIIGVQSVAIASNFVAVVAQNDDEIRFRGADFSDAVRVGARDVVLARIELQGLAPGIVQISVSVVLFTGEDSQPITPMVSSHQLEFFAGPPTLDPQHSPPQDLDGDGLFEDVNGDGVFNADDALLLAFNVDSAVVLNNVQFFDFNGDGRISFEDAVRLNQMVS